MAKRGRKPKKQKLEELKRKEGKVNLNLEELELTSNIEAQVKDELKKDIKITELEENEDVEEIKLDDVLEEFGLKDLIEENGKEEEKAEIEEQEQEEGKDNNNNNDLKEFEEMIKTEEEKEKEQKNTKELKEKDEEDKECLLKKEILSLKQEIKEIKDLLTQNINMTKRIYEEFLPEITKIEKLVKNTEGVIIKRIDLIGEVLMKQIKEVSLNPASPQSYPTISSSSTSLEKKTNKDDIDWDEIKININKFVHKQLKESGNRMEARILLKKVKEEFNLNKRTISKLVSYLVKKKYFNYDNLTKTFYL